MGNYAFEYYAEDAVFPTEGQVADGVDFGPTGADFTGSASSATYTAAGNVRFGVDRGDGVDGTLVLPAIGEVEDGVFFGAGGTEYEGTLVVTGGSGPANPSLSTLSVLCVDEYAEIEVGVIVKARITKSPTGSIGYAFDGKSQVAISNESGIASLTVVRGAEYQIRRGNCQQWEKVLIADSDTTLVGSFIGS